MKEALKVKGRYLIEIIRDGKVIDREEVENVVTVEGRTYLLKAGVSGEQTPVSFYVGLIGADITPQETDTASTALGSTGSYGEVVSYNETDRPIYRAVASSASVSNAANPAQFTISANTTVYGAFITSTSAKQSNSGILLCAARFASPKTLAVNDVISITYAIAALY